MAYWDDIWRIINGEPVSVARTGSGSAAVRDSRRFRGLPLKRQERVNAIILNEQKKQAVRLAGRNLDSLDDVRKRSSRLVPAILNNYTTTKPLTQAVQDAIMNMPTMSGVYGQDPSTMNRVSANVWISPQTVLWTGMKKAILPYQMKSPPS